MAKHGKHQIQELQHSRWRDQLPGAGGQEGPGNGTKERCLNCGMKGSTAVPQVNKGETFQVKETQEAETQGRSGGPSGTINNLISQV